MSWAEIAKKGAETKQVDLPKKVQPPQLSKAFSPSTYFYKQGKPFSVFCDGKELNKREREEYARKEANSAALWKALESRNGWYRHEGGPASDDVLLYLSSLPINLSYREAWHCTYGILRLALQLKPVSLPLIQNLVQQMKKSDFRNDFGDTCRNLEQLEGDLLFYIQFNTEVDQVQKMLQTKLDELYMV